MKNLAFLAPEIPSLSATFVYNEILALQKQGYTIIPISVHLPSFPAHGSLLQELAAKTHYLYQKGLPDFCIAVLQISLSSPSRFLRCLTTLFQDVRKVGLTTKSGLGLIYRFCAACRVARILYSSRCDHLHVHFAHVPTDIAMYASIMSGISFSFTSHANDLFERGWLLTEKIGRAKFAVTISEFNRNFLVASGGQLNKIHIIRCGVDSNKFFATNSKTVSPPYRIGTIGRMVEKKGFDTLLHAAVLLQAQGIDFRLTIAGNGPLECKLRHLASRLYLTSVVEFPGAMSNDCVPGWLRTLDLFVLPCRKDINGDMDGIPVVLMEAMLSGIPVIATRISGIPELITHENEGLLVAPQDATELARAITRLLLDNNLWRSLSKNAQQKVTSEFDETLNIQQLINLLSTSSTCTIY